MQKDSKAGLFDGKKQEKITNISGAMESDPNSHVPAIYVAKYNRFVDNILGRINKILRTNYDPVTVKLTNPGTTTKSSKTKSKKKSNKKSSTKNGSKQFFAEDSSSEVPKESTTSSAPKVIIPAGKKTSCYQQKFIELR